MKLATVRYDSGTRVVSRDGGVTRLLDHTNMAEALADGITTDRNVIRGVALDDSEPLSFAPCVSNPGKVLCVGHNYKAHILEMGHGLPDSPTVFSKFAGALIGPHDDIELNHLSSSWDWEAELAVVIGSTVRRGDRDAAGAAIAGYTIANDVSARDWQKKTSQWLLGKTFEGTTPLGPWLVTADELDPAGRLDISCTVDGTVVQSANTADLLFDPVDLVAYLSQVITLEPGDVVLTGTPGGVGAARSPQVFLKPGQEVVTTIEKLGSCRNTTVAT
ncbi:fumarylacetoacetate hydrolase family protein [Rhodococcus fascians]|nr:fumarylacetoacetate hydrolase family protein [Rhodococcus fascians]